MTTHDLEGIASSPVAHGRGILGPPMTVSILTRFDKLGIQSTEQSRCNHREMLYTEPSAADLIGIGGRRG